MAIDKVVTIFCTIFVLLHCASKVTFSQIVSISDNPTLNVQCPSGFTCISGSRNVSVEWGYNGHLCPGQNDGDCYNGEKDPRGFQRGPMQKPVIIYTGDRLFFTTITGLEIRPFNVTRSVFYGCKAFATENAVIATPSSSIFEIPNKYVNNSGTTYFIAETTSSVYRCDFGIRLEVFVHSTSLCINPAQGDALCSGTGLCAITNKFFAYNQTCVCGAGYSGTYCEELNSCFSSRDPCKNGATCVDKQSGLLNDYECKCMVGYTGKNCEINIDDCIPDPCANKSICIDGIATYTCLCGPGYNGKNCSNLIPNQCEPNPCENGGTCSLDNDRENYVCKCPAPFVGQNCSINSTLLSSSIPIAISSTAGSSTIQVSSHVSSSQTVTLSSTRLSMVSQLTPLSTITTSSSVQTTSSVDRSLVSMLTSSAMITSSQIILTSSLDLSLVSSLTPSTFITMLSSAVLTPSSVLSMVSTLTPSTTLITSVPATTQSLFLHSSNVQTQSMSILGDSFTVLTSSVVQPSSASPMSTAMLSTSTYLTTVSPSSTLLQSSTASSTQSSTRPTSIRPTHSSSAPDVSTVHPPSSSSVMKTALPSSTSDVKTVVVTSRPTTPTVSSNTMATSQSLMSSVVSTTSKAPTSVGPSSATTHTTTYTVVNTTSALLASETTLLPTSTLKTTTSVMPTASSVAVTNQTTTVVSSSKTPPTSQATTTIPTLPSATILQTSTVVPSQTSTVVVPTSTVVPTTVPPTTKPLIQHTCKDNPCNSGVCLDVPDYLGFNFTCQCPKPYYGPRCSTDYKLYFPRFGNNSYLVHKALNSLKEFKIVITFKTTKPDGLLFYSTHSKYRDFIQLYITDGNLEFRFDPGDSLVGIRSSVKVNTGKIVTAVLTYNNKEGILQVDNNQIQRNKALGKTVGIDLDDQLYIGGLPSGKAFGVNDNAKTTPTLNGCIRDIELNGKNILFTDATDWNNLNECDQPCDNKPCHNGGNCTNDADNPHEYQCSCAVGYEGTNCKKYTVCSGDPCKGGLCIADVGKNSKTCLCPYGRAGITCEIELNITIPCLSMVSNYSSYIQYQTPINSGDYFAVTLQFKLDNTTSAAQNSLLVYSGPDQYPAYGFDFVALGINDNKVVFQYDLGSGIARITSDVLDSKLEWHSVTAGRKYQEGYLYVDSQLSKRGSSLGGHTGLNLYNPLYIGGIPEISELPNYVDFRSGFQGCVSSMAVRFGETKPFINLLTTQTGSSGWPVVSGRNVGDKNYSSCQSNNPCQNNGTCVAQGASVSCTCQDGWHGMFCSSKSIPCVNHNPCASWSTCREVNNKAVCDCPLGKTGSTCSQSISIQTPRFNENSYMAFNPKNTSGQLIYIRTTTNIKITFTPTTANGLLFYVTHQISSQRGDFLSISLHNGIVHYRYDLGSGNANLQSQKSISLNMQHSIEVTRTSKTGTLKLNGDPVITGSSSGNAIALDVGSDFYVGGVPQLSYVNPSAVFDSSSLKDYVGCVSSVQINNVKLPLTETGAKEGRNIDNCPSSNPVVT